jgi:cystathionine beta-lyase
LLGGAPFTPMAALSPEIARRTITLIAPSKTFNIAGLFCGFAIIPDPELREKFKKVAERMTLHVSSLGLVAAEAALSGECDDWLAALNTYLTANRDFISDFAVERLPGIRVSRPDATYLGWFDCSALKTESPYKFFLENAKVALNDGAAFGTGGEGFVRFNFGAPRELLAEGLDRMAKALR